jgi:hypothetical protein
MGLILAAGVAFTLQLVLEIPEGVFYSPDGGLKFDLARRMFHEGGAFRGELEAAASPWAKELWADGLSPFGPPFVYERAGKSIVAFSVFFPAVTAPWYELLGFRGLYVVPLLSAWALWALFAWGAPRCGLSRTATAAALAAIVFASPLTLYAAIYWENTASVLLAFAGVALFIARRSPSLAAGAGAGALLGLAGWLRPEQALFALLTVFLSLAFPRVGGGRRTQLGLALGVCALLLVLALWNVATSGTVGGFQSLQWGTDERGILAPAVDRLKALLTVFPQWYPLAPAAIIGFAALRFRHASNPALTEVGRFLLLLSLLLFLLVPFGVARGVAKQLGPRYLLVLVPVMGFLLGLAWDQLWATGRPRLRLLAALVFVIALAAGIHRNVVVGSRALRNDYALRMRPLIATVQKDPTPVIAVSDQRIAQDLVTLWDSRTFFLVQSAEDVTKLVSGMRKQGKDKFLLLTYGDTPALEGGRVNTDEGPLLLTFSGGEMRGICRVFRAEAMH